MAYSITRGLKIKDRTQMASMANHNFRIKGAQDNVDASRSPLNRLLVNKLGVNTKSAGDLNTKLTAYYEELGIKERADNVLMLEFIATASPEWFEGKTPAQVDEWVEAQVAFFESEFGANLKIACLHLDEKTPHLHLAVSTEEQKTRRFKNRHGSGEKTSYSLNANRWNPEFFTGLQTRYSETNARFGLERGEYKSKAKHKDLLEAVAELKAEDARKRLVISGARKALKQTRDLVNELVDDLLVLIDIVSGKELDEDETSEVARVIKRVKSPKKPPKVKK